MLPKEEQIKKRIEQKYGIVFEIKDDVVVPPPYRMMNDFYQTVLDKIKKLKPGKNFKISIKESKTPLQSIRVNILNHITTKIPFKNEIMIIKRKNDLYIMREEKNAKKINL